MGDSFFKKENAKKKVKKQREKALRREDRKTNNNKGKTLEDMLVYVDHQGNFTTTRPGERPDEEAAPIVAPKDNTPEDVQRTGIVTLFFDQKGFGFITDDISGEQLFVHTSEIQQQIQERDRVTFTIGRGPKGLNAQQVTKLPNA
ncbi:cold-shock protein [Zhouia sp. PK063]|uniref:cold-shock protein n=1 Tax=Zhouia sp. PK063 TaxID=3373602 RepID=UPI0037ACA66F